MSHALSPSKIRLAANRPSIRGSSPLGLAGSLLFHAAILAGALMTWQHRADLIDDTAPVVPVELVTIAEKTNIKAEAPQPAFVQKPPMPIAAPKVDVPPPQLTVTPPKPLAEAEPAPAVKPLARPEPPKPKPVAKKEQFNPDDVLALLNKQKPSAAPANATGTQARRGIGAQTAMTMDLADALRNEIAQCWSPPVGAPKAADLVVIFDLYLNPDGSVARAPQLAANSASGGTFAKAAEDAARRAIYECAPYKLPAARYSDWRTIEIQFDPRQMMGER